jgi:hypothetical protein
MCCDDELAPAVGEALARYRSLLSRTPLDWGSEAPDVMLDVLDLARTWGLPALGPVLAGMGEDRRIDAAAAVRLLVADGVALPAGVVVVDVGTGQVRHGDPLNVLTRSDGPATWQPDGVVVVVLNDGPDAVDVQGAGVTSVVEAGSVARVQVPARLPAERLQVGAHEVDLAPVLRAVPAGVLRLTSATPVRWTVLDEQGQPWAPAGGRLKHDVHDRPFFHAQEATVELPVGPARVTAARGSEHTVVTAAPEVQEGSATTVRLDPQRWWDGDGGGLDRRRPARARELLGRPGGLAARRRPDAAGRGARPDGPRGGELARRRGLRRGARREPAGPAAAPPARHHGLRHRVPQRPARSLPRYRRAHDADPLGHGARGELAPVGLAGQRRDRGRAA